MIKPGRLKEHVFQCVCHDFHFATLSWWEGEDCLELGGYLSIGGDYWTTIWDRVKGAWYVLSGRNAHAVEVILDPAKAEELKRIIELFLVDARKEKCD
jgi:hypothetical protein